MTAEILFLSHRPPWPPDRGDKIRSWHLVERLARLAPVHLASLADDAAEAAVATPPGLELASCRIEPRRIGRLAAAASGLLGGKPLLLSIFDNDALRDHVRRLVETRPIACIMAYSVQMAQFVPEVPGDVRFVMDFVDVDSAKFESYARTGNPLMRAIYAREARLLSGYELSIARRADLGVFVSETEAALFRERSGLGDDRIRALRNGVDLAYFDPAVDHVRPDAPAPLIVFTGQMDYRPNVEAVAGFARDVLPRVRAVRPDARFAIVGRRPDPAVQALAGLAGVIVTGEVPDVRGWLAAADVVVAPLGIARGVQNKVLEAMAMARALVASPTAFEGIDARPGAELIVADGAEAQADAVLRLIGDPGLAQAMGDAARARIVADYGWAARLAPLPEMVGLARAPLMDAAE